MGFLSGCNAKDLDSGVSRPDPQVLRFDVLEVVRVQGLGFYGLGF